MQHDQENVAPIWATNSEGMSGSRLSRQPHRYVASPKPPDPQNSMLRDNYYNPEYNSRMEIGSVEIVSQVEESLLMGVEH